MKNSFDTRTTLNVGNTEYGIYSVKALEGAYGVGRLPFAQKILLENLLRHEDGINVTRDDIEAFVLDLAREHGSRDARLEHRLSDLGIDSLTLSDHMGALERRFRVQMDAEIADVDTLKELVEYIDART